MYLKDGQSMGWNPTYDDEEAQKDNIYKEISRLRKPWVLKLQGFGVPPDYSAII